jgi:hypothetical protein
VDEYIFKIALFEGVVIVFNVLCNFLVPIIVVNTYYFQSYPNGVMFSERQIVA